MPVKIRIPDTNSVCTIDYEVDQWMIRNHLFGPEWDKRTSIRKRSGAVECRTVNGRVFLLKYFVGRIMLGDEYGVGRPIADPKDGDELNLLSENIQWISGGDLYSRMAKQISVRGNVGLDYYNRTFHIKLQHHDTPIRLRFFHILEALPVYRLYKEEFLL